MKAGAFLGVAGVSRDFQAASGFKSFSSSEQEPAWIMESLVNNQIRFFLNHPVCVGYQQKARSFLANPPRSRDLRVLAGTSL